MSKVQVIVSLIGGLFMLLVALLPAHQFSLWFNVSAEDIKTGTFTDATPRKSIVMAIVLAMTLAGVLMLRGKGIH